MCRNALWNVFHVWHVYHFFHKGCIWTLSLYQRHPCILLELTLLLIPFAKYIRFIKHVPPKHVLLEIESNTAQFWGCYLKMLMWHVSTLLSWKRGCARWKCLQQVWVCISWGVMRGWKKSTPVYRCLCAACVKYIHLTHTFQCLCKSGCLQSCISLDKLLTPGCDRRFQTNSLFEYSRKYWCLNND